MSCSFEVISMGSLHAPAPCKNLLLLDRQAFPSSLMFLKVHKTPYLHRFFHYPPAILGIIILMHVLTFLVSLFTIDLLPLEISKMPYLPHYLMDFDQIKRV